MVAVPSRLRPWSAELSAIHASCWPLLGKLLPSLDGMLFRHHLGLDSQQAIPDGFSGVDYKGNLEGLLPTEWAFLDCYSDEFYRRIVNRESQYFKPSYEKQIVPQSFNILLDRGPDQYGAPFLIQLALLFVLLRRSRELGLPLQVGYLQRPGQWTTATLETLANRIHPCVDRGRVIPPMLAAWQEEIAKCDLDLNAIWIAASPRHQSDFTVGQGLFIEADRQANGRIGVFFQPSRKRFQFQLSDDDGALRLLRRPFERTPTLLPATETDGREQLFRLHAVGRKCFFFHENERLGNKLIAFSIPNRATGRNARLKLQSQIIKNPLLGVSCRKSRLCTVTVEGVFLLCEGFFKQAEIRIPFGQVPETLSIPKSCNSLPLAYVIRANDRASIVIGDNDSQGFILAFLRNSKNEDFYFDKCIALGAMLHSYFCYSMLFYTDGDRTVYELSSGSLYPKSYRCDRKVRGFIKCNTRVEGKSVNVLPLTADERGMWNSNLRRLFNVTIEDAIVGGDYHYLISRRGNNQIWVFKRDYQTSAPAPGNLLIQTEEDILGIDYQPENRLIAYQTAYIFKVYDLNLKAEVINKELRTYGFI